MRQSLLHINLHIRQLLFVGMFFLATVLQAQISGTVFRDYNGNGTRETAAPTIEPGVPNVVVNAYNASNSLIATATTTAAGTYSIPFTVAVRIEFVLPSSSGICVNNVEDYSSFGANGSNIRFVSASTSTLNYAINSPDDYINTTNPNVYLPQFVAGDPLGGGDAGTNFGFKGHPFTLAGNPITSTLNLAASQIGATWGVAYSKQAGKIFTSAFLKRHVGLGPMGSGGIYLLTPTATSFTVTQFYDMDAAGNRTCAGAGAPAYGDGTSFNIVGDTTLTYLGAIDTASGAPVGLGVIGVNGAGGRNLSATINVDSYDPAAFGQVGKVGLGDIEISDDGQYLFVMNLYDRKLYRLTLNNAANPTSVTFVASYSLPTVSVTNGILRPFAVKYHRGKVYVGAVASGENGGQNIVPNGATDLYSYVFELNNPTGAASFNNTPVISYPLNYRKGYTINNSITQWYPWAKATTRLFDVGGEKGYPTPLLTNIDFTDNGDMIMDFTDRSGHQWGYYNFRDLRNTTTQVQLDLGGDILIAGLNCGTGTFTLESNGSYSSNGTTRTSAGAGNNEGPGGGEFFYMDYPPDQYHHETSQGALAILPGSQNAIVTVMDPASPFSGGTAHFSTIDGTSSVLANIYLDSQNGAFSKANGLGDIEMAGTEAPLEIGNRVWTDADGDGIQDAGENGIGNVTVELYADFNTDNQPDGAVLATTTTNTTAGDLLGTWYFNATNVIDGDPTLGGNQAGIQKGKNYLVRIGNTTWAAGVGLGNLSNLFVTSPNIIGAGQADLSDNDATLVSNIPQISTIQINAAGQNNHSFDFGFAPRGSVGNYVWLDENGNGLQDEPANKGINGINVQLWSAGANGVIGGGDDVQIGTTIQTANDGLGNPGYYNFIITNNDNYYVKFPTTSGIHIPTTQNTAAGVNGNSDITAATGNSPVFAINISGVGVAKDNATIDAGYTCPNGCLNVGVTKK